MANSQQLWYENRISPHQRIEPPKWYEAWLKLLSKKIEKSSPNRGRRNETRDRALTDRQKERIRIMSGAFDDDMVDEKVALDNSSMLGVQRADVLVGQGGKYLHPRLFRTRVI